MELDATHDPMLTSWVASAQSKRTDFPLQNLPHGVFRRRGSAEAWRGGVAIGDAILDMAQASALGVFEAAAEPAARAAAMSSLNTLMGLGPPAWRALRSELSRLLRVGAAEEAVLRRCLLPQAEAEYALPAHIGDYTDFFTSYEHMLNAGRILMPGAPPLANFKWLPIAYHGRASTVEVSGSGFHRPWGQLRPPGATAPEYSPCRRLDYELELAFWVGPGNRRGEPIDIDDALDHLFGASLFNDWSARDVQAWESMPLGPFLSKNFLSTVSPWIVTMQALAPFRTTLTRTPEDPPTIANLHPRRADAAPAYDIALDAWLQTANGSLTRVSHTNFKHSHWSAAQMLAHHTEGGCSLRPGDLLGTGTQSGAGPGEQGCLLELSRNGEVPVMLSDGQTRAYLHDGDTVTLRGRCERPGAAGIGFGECSGTVLAAMPRMDGCKSPL